MSEEHERNIDERERERMKEDQGFESCLDKEGIIWTSMGQMKEM